LQHRLGTDDLSAWLEAEADQLSSHGRIPAGYIHFSQALLQRRKIQRICESDVIGKACIKPSQDEYYEITCNPILSHRALRFAIAHEIGHTYWFKPGGGAKPLSPLQRRLGRDPDIEYLCNRFAESLLLPLSEIQSLGIQDQESLPRLDLISSVSTKYKLEERAVVRKLFAGKGSRFAGVVCLQKLPTQKWTTRWSVIPKWA
jgi:Zn-dependent peptidase ImmA (M78 family)